MFLIPYACSTSNHNHVCERERNTLVVLYSASTSNHNIEYEDGAEVELFFIPLLHQTTTRPASHKKRQGCSLFRFYIKPQLTGAISALLGCCSLFRFYIKPQPRRTTSPACFRCSLFRFYIKPQQKNRILKCPRRCSLFRFYIKPQPSFVNPWMIASCSLFRFYIKPQLSGSCPRLPRVVLYSASTSNHNLVKQQVLFFFVVLYSASTSNHNRR